MDRFPDSSGPEQEQPKPSPDAELVKQLATIKETASLPHKTPTREWPLTFAHEHELMLIVREWPDGEITAFLTTEHRR